MNPQPAPPKRALSSSPNQEMHANPERHCAPKRSKNIVTDRKPALDPARDHSPPRTDRKVYALLEKMSVRDGRLAKLLSKLGEGGTMPQSEYDAFERYYDTAQYAIELRARDAQIATVSRAHPPPTIEKQTVEDLVDSKKKAEAAKLEQHISPMPPVQPDVERPMAPVTHATDMPSAQPPKTYSPLFLSPEPESHAGKIITSTRKSCEAGDNGSAPPSQYRQPSFDHTAMPFTNSSANSIQPSPNASVYSTAPRPRPNAAGTSGLSRSSSVAINGTLRCSVNPTTESANNSSMFPPSVHHSKARITRHHQVEKGKAAVDSVIDEGAKFFAKYKKKKPTNQDLARYRQGDELAIAPRNETEEILDPLSNSGVEVWETEALERHILKDQFGSTRPYVDNMMRSNFSPVQPSVEKPRNNVEPQRPAVNSADLQNYKATVKKLQGKVGKKEGVISEKDSKITKLRAEVNQLKQIQTRSKEREQALAEVTKHLKDAEKEKRKLKAQLVETQNDLERAQGKTLVNDVGMSKYEDRTQAREETDIEIEAANLRNENAALKKAIASLQSQKDPFVGYHFAHTNLFASPLVATPMPIRASRAQEAAAPPRERYRQSRSVSNAASDEVESNEGSVYSEGTSDGESEWEEGQVRTTKNQRSMTALDGWLEMPALPKPMRLDGVLAYRDATRVRQLYLTHG